MEKIVFQSSISAPIRHWRTQWQSWWLRNRTGQSFTSTSQRSKVSLMLRLGQNVGRRCSVAILLRSPNPCIPVSDSHSASTRSSCITASSPIQSTCSCALHLRSTTPWGEHVGSFVRCCLAYGHPEPLCACQRFAS